MRFAPHCVKKKASRQRPSPPRSCFQYVCPNCCPVQGVVRQIIRGCRRSNTLLSNRRLARYSGSRRHPKWRRSTPEGSTVSNLGNSPQRGQHCAASNSAEQQGKGAARSRAELRREKKPLERPKRERDLYLKKLRGGRAMLISPHTMSRPGRPARKHFCWATAKASATAWGPDTGFLAYLKER